ncbi:MAG: hypothetical protein P1P69_08240, partial [Methanosarcinaceae archaeon]|nr:hypothetical protein [Methanosarcinaceae archaeon]
EEGKRCRRLAVGKGQFCKEHGGEERIRDNYLVKADENSDSTYALLKQIKGKGMVYDQKKHPVEFLRFI